MRDARIGRHWLASLVLLPFLIQCHEASVTGPGLPDEIRATAIRLHVDLSQGTVAQVATPSNNQLSLALIGSDGVALQTSNVVQTPIKSTRKRVQFDVAITNSLNDVILVKPTVPTPPAEATGIVLFPFQANVTTGSGTIAQSTDWDGAPYNFFNDGKCTSGNRDCFRWENYPSPLAPGATTAARTVGFEMNTDVTAFDVVMLVEADLVNVTPAASAISLSATTASFSSTNGSVPDAVPIVVSNSGGGTLGGLTATVTYQQGQLGGWLTANLSSTTAPSMLTLSAYPGIFQDGTYNATVSIESAGVSNSPQTVSVTFVITGSAYVSAIYVSQDDPSAVDDATCGLGPVGSGTGNHPCRSIAQGFARASVVNRTELRVADGRYTESVTLVNGRRLLGGYDPQTWQRHLATTNTIIDGVSSVGNHDRTVIATGITSPTMFEGFVVRGSVNTKIGGNSYAIYVSGSTANLSIRSNTIYGGIGGPGLQGSSGSTVFPGQDGIGRESNPAGYDAFVATTSPCTQTRQWNNGGLTFAGTDNISGGAGGGNRCPPSNTLTQYSAIDGNVGEPGDGPSGGAAGGGGAGGYDFRLESNGTLCVAASSPQDGANGGAGGNGQAGPAVLGAAVNDGSVVSGHWVGASGQAGVDGFNGGGGGGGGAGGGAFSVSTADNKDRIGGHGGGGGAGGRGGPGGTGGSAGGAVFGIFVVGTAPDISNNTIVRGSGGNGGIGGAGQAGSSGGVGGEGGATNVFCAGHGGRGGKGGAGGAGSGGGGGAGGASFAIYTSGAGTPNYCTTAGNSISGGAGGAGGQGGSSPANPGGSGVAGTLQTCSFH